MKTETVSINCDNQIKEAENLLAKQWLIGLTLLARAFAKKFNDNTPDGGGTAYSEAWKHLYNQDAEKAVVLTKELFRGQKVFLGAVICSLIMYFICNVVAENQSGYQLGAASIGVMSVMLALVSGAGYFFERRKLSGYTVRLAKNWLKVKAVLTWNGIVTEVGESILPTYRNNDRRDSAIEADVRLTTGDIPELSQKLFCRIQSSIEKKLAQLARRNKKAQARPGLSDVKYSREQMSKLISAAEKVTEINSSAALRKAFEEAEREMRLEIEGDKTAKS